MAADPRLQPVATPAKNGGTTPTTSCVDLSTGISSPPVGAKPPVLAVTMQTSPVRCDRDTGSLQKHLEAARTGNQLLQATVDDQQRRLATLEATEASLSREVQSKEAHIAAQTRQMRDMFAKFEVCWNPLWLHPPEPVSLPG